MPLNKVLLAVDDSEYSKKATGLLLEIGKNNKNLQVTILHVVEPIPNLIGGDAREQIKEELLAEGEKIIAPHRAMLAQAGIAVTTRQAQGSPGSVILEVAEEEHFDMITMGSRGRTSVSEIVLGSVSQKVLHYYHGPVLIAR